MLQAEDAGHSVHAALSPEAARPPIDFVARGVLDLALFDVLQHLLAVLEEHEVLLCKVQRLQQDAAQRLQCCDKSAADGCRAL